MSGADPTILDKILNVVIPTGAVVFFAAVLYRKLKEPIDALFGGVKGLFSKAKDKTQEGIEKFEDENYIYIPKN